ncbi:hypothetical protein ACFO0N_15060 [Halobium salinum]|uniref:Uncharacterized protein n=1 Tax=Halobium salinum TaxID=1364940 RepID=A0ABD5PEY2_9EURY|nr:hypothetical protein [Halobium salinum]
MPWFISAIQHRFLDTTDDLLARLNSIPNDIPEDDYQGQLTDKVTTEATEEVVTYFEATHIT